MARVKGLRQHFDAPMSWHLYEVKMNLDYDADTGEINIPLDTLPVDVIVAGMSLQVTLQDAGATATRLDVEIDGTAAWSVGADALGSTGFDQATAAEVGLTNFALGFAPTVPSVLNMEVTISGTATRLPEFVFMILCGRVDY